MDKIQRNKGHLTFIRPSVDTAGAVRLACSLYGLKISDPSLVREFVCYDDRNFYMKGTLPHVHHVHGKDGEGLLRKSEDEFVLKILNHVDSENISSVQGQNEALLFLKEMGFACPVPSRALNGEYTIKCSLNPVEVGNTRKDEEDEQSDRVFAVRLLSFVPGKLLRDVPCTAEVLFSLGRYTAKMNKALQGFHHPGVVYLTKKEWDLSKIHIIKSYIPIVTQDDTKRKVLTRVYDSFVNNVIPQLKNLTKQAIHGDLNDENILVEPNHCGDGYEVASFIDFGDISVSYRMFEVAICMMYMILQRVRQGDAHDEAVRVAGHVLCGYQSVCSLSQSELNLLYWSVAARFFQSIVNGKYKQSLEPENVYLSNCCDLGLDVLSSYVAMKGEEVLHSWLSLAAKKANI